MTVNGNGITKLNYFPNSYDLSTTNKIYSEPPVDISGYIARHVYPTGEIDYEQTRALYTRVLSEYDKTNLVNNISKSLSKADIRLQYRMAAVIYKADIEYSTRVSNILKLDVENIKKLAYMSDEERANNTRN
ncbi:Catalase [compost metagenome]